MSNPPIAHYASFGPGIVYDYPNHVPMEQKKLSIHRQFSNQCWDGWKATSQTTMSLPLDSKTRILIRRVIFQLFKTISAAGAPQGTGISASLDKQSVNLYHDSDGGFKPINLIFPRLPLTSYKNRDIAKKAQNEFCVNIIGKSRAENRLVGTIAQMTHYPYSTSCFSIAGRARYDSCSL